MIAALLTQFGPWIVGIGALVLAFFGVKTSMTKSAQAEGRATAAETIAKDREAIAAAAVKASHAANEQKTKAVQNANDSANDVGKLPNGAAADELRDKWARD